MLDTSGKNALKISADSCQIMSSFLVVSYKISADS